MMFEMTNKNLNILRNLKQYPGVKAYTKNTVIKREKSMINHNNSKIIFYENVFITNGKSSVISCK